MSFARNLIIVAGSVSFLTFIAFFGRLPAFRLLHASLHSVRLHAHQYRNTPIGFLHRLLVVRFPAALARLDRALTNGRISRGGARLGHHLMHDKHPLVVVFFLGLVTACAAMLLPTVWFLLHPAQKLIALILLPQPYLFLYLSARQNTQTYITTHNHAEQMRHYPYDRVLYHPGVDCSTCNFQKPARSKHCSICKTCVSRMDHHCIWVNNCLGRGNYKWFIALLLSTGILIAYGAYLAWYALSPLVHGHYAKYERWYLYEPSPGSDPSSWGTYFATKLHYFVTFLGIYLNIGGLSASGVGLLALLTWPLPLGLLSYHIYLIWAGMTTNESSKWSDWRDDMADGVVFLGHRKESTMRHSSSSSTYAPTTLDSEEPLTTWPIESRHILVRTRDGQPPKSLPRAVQAVADESRFERVWSLVAVENVYDLGFADNLREVLFN
jgi:hypothetical protein